MHMPVKSKQIQFLSTILSSLILEKCDQIWSLCSAANLAFRVSLSQTPGEEMCETKSCASLRPPMQHSKLIPFRINCTPFLSLLSSRISIFIFIKVLKSCPKSLIFNHVIGIRRCYWLVSVKLEDLWVSLRLTPWFRDSLFSIWYLNSHLQVSEKHPIQ